MDKINDVMNIYDLNKIDKIVIINITFPKIFIYINTEIRCI